MKRNVYVWYFMALLLVFGANAQNVKNGAVSQQEVIPGYVVVKVKPGYSMESSANARTSGLASQLEIAVEWEKPFRQAANARQAYKSGIDFNNYFKVKFDRSINVQTVISQFEKMDGVEYVEPLYVDQFTLVPNDPGLDAQYYLGLIKAFEAWDVVTGSSDIVVAVIDSGVDYEHEDLNDKLYVNEGEIPENGIDDDEDGFVDNYLGWDFVGGSFENNLPDGDPINTGKDSRGHGTWVTGCIAAEGDNEAGIAGVSFGVQYMALKCGEDAVVDSRSVFFGYDALIYAADHGADVINMSWSGGTFSQFAQDVVTYAAIEKDAVLVAAAGNDGVEQPEYPAAYEHVISVAATNENDVKAGFSTFDASVDLSAPGVSIFTTSPQQEYSSVQGTSFSSPIVAGAAALLRSHFPNYNQFQIATLLIQSADDIDDLNNEDLRGKLGVGRLNIENALQLTTPALRINEVSLESGTGETPLAGETVTFKLSVINELDPSSANATVRVDTTNGNPLSFEGISESLNVLSQDQTQSFDPLFTLDLPGSIPFNQQLDFMVTIEDPDNNFSISTVVSFVVNPLVTEAKAAPYLLTDGGDFESNPDDFRSAAISGGIDVWELGEPSNALTTANSGTNVWKTDLDGDYPQASFECVLQSPIFDMAEEANYTLSFYKSMESEFCNAPMAVQVQYSVDEGLHWETLGTYQDPRGENWYNKDPNTEVNGGCPIADDIIANQEGWIGNFENEFTSYNISSLSGNTGVVFRIFVAVNGNYNGDYNNDGFMIDDFQIVKEPAKAEFAPSKVISYTNVPITFDYFSRGQVAIAWDFGDGSTSSAESPLHAYLEPGTYTVTLSVENGEATETNTVDIQILPDMASNFGLAEGGDLETDISDVFGVLNVGGTPIELGSSTISGKDGTSSGDFAFVTGLTEEEYQDNSEAYIYFPNFDFTLLGTYTFNFSSKFSFESDFDGFIIEYSLNKGESWIKLNDELDETWYNSSSEGSVFVPEGAPIFSGTTNGEFQAFSANISQLSGNANVAFRLKFLTDGDEVDIGAAFDDFFLEAPVAGPIVAGLSSDVPSGCLGDEITFQSTSTGTISAITWDFGDGAEPATASGPGPHTVVFNTTGTRTVTMTASNDNESEIATQDVSIGDEHSPSIEEIGIAQDGSVILQASEGDGYRWYLENVLIAGANERTYNAPEDGNYTAEVSVEGCFQFATNVIQAVTGLENIKVLTLHPNPTVDVLKVDAGQFGAGNVQVQVYGLTGKKYPAITSSLEGTQLQVDVSILEKGIYLLHVEDGETNWVGRFIKE